MPIKPPKQFCGDEHWSGETCKKCDAIKARKFPRDMNQPATPNPPLPRAVECLGCAAKSASLAEAFERIQHHRDEIEALRLKVAEYETRAERERLATLERVRAYRAKKAKP